MAEAINVGASMVNDVNGLRARGAMNVVSQANVPVCIMHMLKTPKDMQQAPHYQNVVTEVINFLQQQIDSCVENGIDRNDIIVDPGIGFGKTLEHNLQLLKSVSKMHSQLDCEVLIGVSRKSMIDAILDRTVDARLPASIGLAVQSALNGAKIIRVHDVRPTFDAIRAVEAVAAHKQ